MSIKYNNEETLLEAHNIDDPTKKQELFESVFNKNQNLALYFVSKYYISGFEYTREDLNQVGLMALWEAIQNYDPNQKAKFSSYASLYIKGKILNYFRDKNWNMYVPKKDKLALQKYNTSTEKLNDLGVELTEENYFAYTDITKEEYNLAIMLKKTSYFLRLDTNTSNSSNINTDDEGLSNYELISNNNVNVEEDVVLKVVLKSFLKELKEDEKAIFIEKHIKEHDNMYISKTKGYSYAKINRIDEKIKSKFIKFLDDDEITEKFNKNKK